MNLVSPIDSLDGNQYIVNSVNNNTEVEGAESFDSVFNSTQEKTLEDIFQQVSEEYGVDIKLLKAVAQAESSFDTNAVSSCGASGIMQLMPETAKGLGVEDVFDAEQNITGGAKMLAYLLDDYNGDTTLALAAYNAGSGAVAKYNGVPPYKETQNYIKRINEILGGGLEVDTSDISIEKNPDVSGVTGEDSTASGSVQNPDLNYRIVLPEDRDDELFSYEDYMRFVDTYNEILSKLFETDDSEDDTDTNNEDNVAITQQQSLYEAQQAIYNPLAVSLLNIK